jgi:hypothetical protein
MELSKASRKDDELYLVNLQTGYSVIVNPHRRIEK